jgi:hypothetical protein
MGKGSFFKKNIRQREKEKKSRGIKQRILEQKKMVEEKIHHVVEVVTEAKKSPELGSVVEKLVVEEKPVVEKLVVEEKPVSLPPLVSPQPVSLPPLVSPQPVLTLAIF